MLLVKQINHRITVSCRSDATIAEYTLLTVIDLDLPMVDNRFILVFLFGLIYFSLQWIITSIGDGIVVSSLSLLKLLASYNCHLEALLDVIREHKLLCKELVCWEEYWRLHSVCFSYYQMTLILGFIIGRNADC